MTIGVSAPPPPLSWNDLPQSSSAFVDTVLHSKLKNAEGKTVTLANVKKPIYFLAGWCKFCAAEDRAFARSKLMDKFQLVNVALDGGEKGTPLTPESITNVGQAKAVLTRDWRYYGIDWPVTNVDFAMPGSPIDQAVHRFPMVLIPHNGKWYVDAGFNPLATLTF